MVGRRAGRALADTETLTRDYRVAFLRYLPQRSEAALAHGYEIGRSAVGEGVSLLDLIHVHHTVLAELLRDSPDRVDDVLEAGGEFLREVLATADMVQRGLTRRSDEQPAPD